MKADRGIENLLLLDGIIIEADADLEYFARFFASKVAVTEGRPHGIKYSLTLHDRKNRRLIGFDNAHAVEDRRKGKFSRHRKQTEWDHKHNFKGTEIIPYDYKTAEKLISDFWTAVNEFIELDKKRG